MPEYSSTTITPADGVQVPSMNGSTSGNFLLSALRDYILASKGLANGLASLGSDGKLTASQLPDLADDVIVVASYAVLPATGTAGKIYITADNNKMYRWDSDLSTPDYVELSVDLSDYATLDDLASEESAREAADTNLNDALTAIDHRVENLEQAHGSYEVKPYKDGAITPSGKGAWAIVEGLRGVSRVENNISEASTTHYQNDVHVVKNSDGSVTLDGTASASGSLGSHNDISITVGHCYLLNMVGDTSKAQIYTDINGNKAVTSAVITANSGSVVSLRASSGTVFSNNVYWVMTTDLNIYFNTSDLSFLGATDSAKLATIQQKYPELLIPSDNGTSAVFSTYTGVKSIGKNLALYVGNTTPVPTEYCMPIEAGTVYTMSIGGTVTGESWRFVFTLRDYDGNLITDPILTSSEEAFTRNNYNVWWWGGNRTKTENHIQVSRPCYMGVGLYNTTATEVQLEKGSTKTAYSAPFTDTLSLTFQGKSAGAVADTCEPNVEVGGVAKKRETQRVGSVDLGSLSWTKYQNRFYATISDAYYSSDNTINLLCEKYIAKAEDTQGYMWLYTGRIYIHDENYANEFAFKSAMDGVILYYELADPVVTLSDPLIDNTLLTEAGGRMATVQTGTVVDGSFDLGFINL